MRIKQYEYSTPAPFYSYLRINKFGHSLSDYGTLLPLYGPTTFVPLFEKPTIFLRFYNATPLPGTVRSYTPTNLLAYVLQAR